MEIELIEGKEGSGRPCVRFTGGSRRVLVRVGYPPLRTIVCDTFGKSQTYQEFQSNNIIRAEENQRKARAINAKIVRNNKDHRI